MSDEAASETSDEEAEKNISFADKAKILGLEEIIESISEVNSNLDFNNSNITNMREEINLIREEKIESDSNASRELSKIIEHTRSLHYIWKP